MYQTKLLFVASLFLLVGCSEGSGGGTGGTGGSGGTGATTTTSSGAGGGECTWTHDCPCGPVLCGYACDGCFKTCDPATPCPDGYWCDYPDDKCGTGEPTGQCKQLSAGGCGEDDRRICSCNGVVPYLCPGVTVAADIADATLCSDGTFACGNLECKKYLEYCETMLPGVQGANPTYACKAGSSGGIVDCSYLPDGPPATCERGADGQIRVTIALP